MRLPSLATKKTSLLYNPVCVSLACVEPGTQFKVATVSVFDQSAMVSPTNPAPKVIVLLEIRN